MKSVGLWYRDGLLPRFSGQQDFAVVDRTTNARAFLTDYKSGRKESEDAADNLQGVCTGAVMLKEYEPTLEEIDGSITEPLVSWDPVRVRYTNASLLEAKKEIIAIVDEAQWHPERRVAGHSGASIVPRAPNCREAIDYSQSLQTRSTMRDVVLEPARRGERGGPTLGTDQGSEKTLRDAREDLHGNSRGRARRVTGIRVAGAR